MFFKEKHFAKEIIRKAEDRNKSGKTDIEVKKGLVEKLKMYIIVILFNFYI